MEVNGHLGFSIALTYASRYSSLFGLQLLDFEDLDLVEIFEFGCNEALILLLIA
jgi:hypothetical protein